MGDLIQLEVVITPQKKRRRNTVYLVANLNIGEDMLADVESDRSCKSTLVMSKLGIDSTKKTCLQEPENRSGYTNHDGRPTTKQGKPETSLAMRRERVKSSRSKRSMTVALAVVFHELQARYCLIESGLYFV